MSHNKALDAEPPIASFLKSMLTGGGPVNANVRLQRPTVRHLFISHASEDKDAFVRPLAEALRERRIDVWYDEFSLKPGDSLRQSIDEGLRNSRCAIVVISEAFIGKNWTEWELNGIIQNSFAESTRLLIPIWHNITSNAVRQYSPSLANIVAIRSKEGVAVVADRIVELVGPSEANKLATTVPLVDIAVRERCAQLLVVVNDHVRSVLQNRKAQLFSHLRVLADSPEGQVLDTVASTVDVVSTRHIPLRGSIAGVAVVNRETVTVADVAPVREWSFVRRLQLAEEIRSMIAIPITSRLRQDKSVVGVLSITANETDAFKMHDSRISTMIPLLQEAVAGVLHL